MNIILIGMMGSGKTTVGKKISLKTDFKFIDMDDFIESKYNMKIPDMFNISEEFFRNRETEVCNDLSELDNCIISCGGGVIKRKENIDLLKQNGVIFYIDRPIDDIAKDVNLSTRPLLKDGPNKLFEIFNERKESYETLCDYRIINDKSGNECADKIIRIYMDKVGR